MPEDKKSNDLFYLCSLIDYISRKTTNHRRDVVNALGCTTLEKIYTLADVYHCDSIDAVADEFIEKANISSGNFDNVSTAKYDIPTYWDMGKVYRNLIKAVAKDRQVGIIDALIMVYNSFISDKIDNYNSSVYYENTPNLLLAFNDGKF